MDDLRANLRAATDLVMRAEQMIPGFTRTWSAIILGDTAEARNRAKAAEARVQELEKALRAIKRNADSWHADEEGLRRAMSVISAWAGDPSCIPRALLTSGGEQERQA